uniref:Immunoglobulin domain-containing protein n=1 Tax=Sinocyclocheilus anshuiensis TaxID=1608454 RepID=A0A671ME48_9TELE
MWDVLFLFSSICTVVAPEIVIGLRGERLDIRCSYEAGYESNSKYLCKGECRNIMVKSGSPAEDERFSLTDDTTARVFTVSITDLRTEDTGLYCCAVERPFTDIYSEILLLVTEGNSCSLFVIIIITAGLVLLLISAVLLVVAVWKKKTCGFTSLLTDDEAIISLFPIPQNASEKGNPAVISNSHTAQSDDGSAANEFHRPANTEAVDTDLDYMNVAAAVRNGVNPDQIYTELNSSRQSHVYQSLRTDSVQEESIYHSIDQTPD